MQPKLLPLLNSLIVLLGIFMLPIWVFVIMWSVKWPKARKNDFLFKKLKNNKMSVNLTLSSFSLYPPLQTSATISPKKKKKLHLVTTIELPLPFISSQLATWSLMKKVQRKKLKQGRLIVITSCCHHIDT